MFTYLENDFQLNKIVLIIKHRLKMIDYIICY